ncbi:MAG: nucleotidyl transferase AbiEii/AbiGii toxin family protein [Patescibacteria group bacterium]
MESNILTDRQQHFLVEFGKAAELRTKFVLTGGTALAGFYYHHRLSEDLDFFSTEEVDPLGVSVFLNHTKPTLGFTSFTSQQSFNRNLFFLSFADGEMLKTEFTYFPFPHIKQPLVQKGIYIDSKLDIAVNKIFTIYQNPRARDFIDLYFLMTQEGYSLGELIKKTRIKFDFHIDPLQLGAQLIRFQELKDLPRMKTALKENTIQTYFVSLAKGLKDQVID